MDDVDLPVLQIACRTLARQALWTEKGPPEIAVSRLAGEFMRLATEQVLAVVESGRDPNLVTRALVYMAYTYVIPSDDKAAWWFGGMLTCLLELAAPSMIQTPESGAFLRDIQNGIAELICPLDS